MKFIKPSVEILEQGPGIQGIYDAIAQAAATCYKSEAKTGEGAKAFVDKLIANKHYAMLEFGTVYLAMEPDTIFPIEANPWAKYRYNPYSSGAYLCEVNGERRVAVTTNYRVLVENGWLDDLQYLCEPTEYHKKRHTARFIISIGTGREFTRHRVFSFAQESTRYCNYSKDKFDKQVSFIIPSWSNSIGEGEYRGPLRYDETDDKEYMFSYGCHMAEGFYKDMILAGASPQEAREVLPLATKSELCMCGFEEDWAHFFELRKDGLTGKPHPDAYQAASMLWEKFKNKGITL